LCLGRFTVTLELLILLKELFILGIIQSL